MKSYDLIPAFFIAGAITGIEPLIHHYNSVSLLEVVFCMVIIVGCTAMARTAWKVR